MRLGNFSVSLAVKDIGASMAFYTALGFEVFHDQSPDGWAILKNGDTAIGLFQGMFPANMLTFNPGWDGDGQPLPDFTDIREIQARLRDAGIDLDSETDADGTGPAAITLTDPDGNPILIDQHVPKPGTP